MYDCSTDEFFLSKDEVNRNDKFFVCTLWLDLAQAGSFTKVITDRNSNDLVFVIGMDYILKYDLSSVVNGALNSEDKKQKLKPVDTF